MNQILEYSANNKNSGGGSSNSDKVVRVFAVLLVIFALCFIGIGAYRYFVKNRTTTTGNSTSDTTQTSARIDITTEDTIAIIKVSHDKAIEKVIYSWDTDKETTDKGDGTSEREIKINLPAGEHTLHVKVIDVDGYETTVEKVIKSTTGTDIINPVIDISVTDDKKLKIVATDETEIAYITYKWNDEDPVRVDVSDDDKLKIETEIEILKGTNDLTVIAVDANNRTTTETKTFSGVTKPTVNINVAADKKSVTVQCSHENGIKSIKLKMNDSEQDVGLQEGEGQKTAEFTIGDLPEGTSTITVTVTSVDQTVTEATAEVTPEETTSTENENIAISIEKTADSEATIKIQYAEGIKDIKFNVNDVDYTAPFEEGTKDALEFKLTLVSGNNNIKVTVVGTDDTENSKQEELTGV